MFQPILHTDNQRTAILIRLMDGAVFLSAGIQKFLFAEKLGAYRFTKVDLPNPETFGPLVATFEMVRGVLIRLGLFTRLAAVPLIIIMLVAIATTKAEVLANEAFLSMMHGSRTDRSMLLGSIFLLIKGGGIWSVDRRIQKA